MREREKDSAKERMDEEEREREIVKRNDEGESARGRARKR